MSGRCHKAPHYSEQEALELIERLQNTKGRKPYRAYRCDRCPFWHTTSTRKSGWRTKRSFD